MNKPVNVCHIEQHPFIFTPQFKIPIKIQSNPLMHEIISIHNQEFERMIVLENDAEQATHLPCILRL